MDQEVVDFLSKHGLDKSIVMDAKGLSGKALREKMDSLCFQLAMNVAPCKKSGHRLRTRYSHCVMCDPTKLRYQNRFSEEAFLYIAKPQASERLVKVGITTNINERTKSLSGYGGYRTWEVVYSKSFPNAGRVEHLVQAELAKHRVIKAYVRDGRQQNAQELFECKPKRVIDLVKSYNGEMLTNGAFKPEAPKIAQKSKRAPSQRAKKVPSKPVKTSKAWSQPHSGKRTSSHESGSLSRYVSSNHALPEMPEADRPESLNTIPAKSELKKAEQPKPAKDRVELQCFSKPLATPRHGIDFGEVFNFILTMSLGIGIIYLVYSSSAP